MSRAGEWKRVSRRRPCPICQKPDWCVYVGNDRAPAAVICARVESGKRCGEAGWLHILRQDGPTWAPWRSTIRRAIKMMQPEAPARDFGRLAARALAAVKPEDLDRLAAALGVSSESLRRLSIGWIADRRAWSFPMRDAAGAITGIRLRLSNGRKLSVKGGREGLFLPADLGDAERLVIAEGPTDTAALLDLGFSAAGRPSCAGGGQHVIDLVKRLRPEQAVIVADSDTPGRRGADALACRLAAYVPEVRVITPPGNLKDARAWLRAGATAADVLAAIDTAPARRLTVTTKTKGRTRCPRKVTA